MKRLQASCNSWRFNAGLTLEEVPTRLHQLQREQKSAASCGGNNVIVPRESDEPLAANNVIGTRSADSADPDNQVVVNSERQTISAGFTGLGLITWSDLVNNRLPLLNLPLDVLEVLRIGEIEYTLAKAIAQIKDEIERAGCLKEAIDNNLSLSQIKSRIKARQPKSSQTLAAQSATELTE